MYEVCTVSDASRKRGAAARTGASRIQGPLLPARAAMSKDEKWHCTEYCTPRTSPSTMQWAAIGQFEAV